jgi:hypothetical protein
LDKSKDVLAVVEAVGAEADAGIAQQTSGLAAMKEGFAASEGVCKDTITGCGANGKVGIAQFKEGTNDVVAAQVRVCVCACVLVCVLVCVCV